MLPVVRCCVAFVLPVFGWVAWAQPTAPLAASAYPTRAIKLVVPFTAGSATDTLARIVGDQLATRWGQPVVVENRPGAGGTIGAAVVARAEPDGYTLAVISVGHVVNAQIYDNLPYDTLRDFAGVIPLGNLPSVLAVPASLGAKSVAELVAMAKARPGALNYASGGVGSASHINAEKFRAATGIDVVHVPTKGAQEMMVETITGRTQFGFYPIIAALPMIRDGKLLALAVSSSRRAAVLPDLPTIAEAGVPDAQFDFWIGLLAPAKTPREIVAKLNIEIARILEQSDVRQRLAGLGVEPMPMSAAQFEGYMREEFTTLGRVMKAAGVTAK
ncbi:MAG: tripartite tricarboxylate transporter substrate binding protein [Pseudomonadota bacterium]|nr:tripartite tricarboxylate transporter substrate binding protein [Pseudomonadota bacterium]